MHSNWCGFKMGLDGATVGSGGGSKSLKVMGLSIFAILLAIISLVDFGIKQSRSGLDINKEIPFKCTSCDYIYLYKIKDLQKMPELAATTQPTTNPAEIMGPMIGPLMMGPLVLKCPHCHIKTLTQAVQCPKCEEIFIMKIDPIKSIFDDKCPKCQESYAKAWQEKYAKQNKTD
ncbi:MAG: hypothetical protein WC975_16090 [Phycisphaerae bacterium]